MTKQRELILSILRQSDRHMTADEIFFLAKLKMPSIAMATVYNNLNALDEAGVIHRLHIDGVADCLDKLTEPHNHLLCQGCGRIQDVRLPTLSEQRARELAEAVGQKIGACYEINDYTTTTETVYGKRLMMSNAALMDSAAAEAEPNVEFEQIKVAYNVSAKFYLITEKP